MLKLSDMQHRVLPRPLSVCYMTIGRPFSSSTGRMHRPQFESMVGEQTAGHDVFAPLGSSSTHLGSSYIGLIKGMVAAVSRRYDSHWSCRSLQIGLRRLLEHFDQKGPDLATLTALEVPSFFRLALVLSGECSSSVEVGVLST